MERGLTLVELLLSITLASILSLTLYSLYSLTASAYREAMAGWYCMQSLRSAIVQLDSDLKQCACLLPQDLKVACQESALFIAGVPLTSSHSGIRVHASIPPPYFSTIRSLSGSSMILDVLDIDASGSYDYWADLGVITESGPCVISHGYSRGDAVLTLKTPAPGSTGERTVPAIHYELKADGLYRNGQLLAEALCTFAPHLDGAEVAIVMEACYHENRERISYTYHLQ
ncbi:MAG: type II secretion system protein [Desulfomonilia bacterium]|jgi:prepilin-type N-terminal cleavage/methylation domain-containing protein|nr:type II secretion system GspH family protein [Deltaproteobacteria bacterium]MDX9760454.1 type II secretion system protein [Desulfomonilia bacterium]HPW68308.1 type II secretion system protein [Deltaproteobacteria bacterium]